MKNKENRIRSVPNQGWDLVPELTSYVVRIQNTINLKLNGFQACLPQNASSCCCSTFDRILQYLQENNKVISSEVSVLRKRFEERIEGLSYYLERVDELERIVQEMKIEKVRMVESTLQELSSQRKTISIMQNTLSETDELNSTLSRQISRLLYEKELLKEKLCLTNGEDLALTHYCLKSRTKSQRFKSVEKNSKYAPIIEMVENLAINEDSEKEFDSVDNDGEKESCCGTEKEEPASCLTNEQPPNNGQQPNNKPTNNEPANSEPITEVIRDTENTTFVLSDTLYDGIEILKSVKEDKTLYFSVRKRLREFEESMTNVGLVSNDIKEHGKGVELLELLAKSKAVEEFFTGTQEPYYVLAQDELQDSVDHLLNYYPRLALLIRDLLFAFLLKCCAEEKTDSKTASDDGPHNKKESPTVCMTEFVPIQEHTVQVESLKKLVSYLQNEIRLQSELRQEAFSELHRIKGNVRLFCRFSPVTGTSLQYSTTRSQIFLQGKDTEERYDFDYLFPEECNNSEVFSEVQDVVLSVAFGTNACIFAYGPTNCGKTHTIEGTSDEDGILQCSLKRLYDLLSAHIRDKKVELAVSCIEVYNEKLFDLLNPSNRQCKLQHTGGATLTGQTLVKSDSLDELLSALKSARLSRRSAETEKNRSSSRGHCLYTIYVTAEEKTNRLNIVDLAGCESSSGVSKCKSARFIETTKINHSLSCLTRVVYALKLKAQHIPFRESKLTELLRDDMTQGSKVAMILNISMSEATEGPVRYALSFSQTASRAVTSTKGKV